MNRKAVLIDALYWRYAVKLFDASKKIPEDMWSDLETSLILTPSSYGLQPWKFMVVTSEAVKKQLTPVSWNQKQVESCSHYVVMLAKNEMTAADVQRFIDRIAEVREVEASSMEGYKKGMISDVVEGARSTWVKEWAARQIYIALGNFMTSAAILGVDTCPMEGIDAAKYDEVLGLKNSGYHTVVACAAGYRSPEDKYQHAKKVRFNRSELFIQK